MSPSHDPSARLVHTEVEVPGTPEAVWRAIATGPGMGAWFVPSEVAEHEGGRVVTHHGPYGASEGTVTAWEPPRRFVYEERDWLPGEDPPPWSTEILVEAQRGGTCVVRLVSGFVSDGDGWEEHLKGTDEGWQWGLRNLRLYLTHFAGEPAAHLWAIGAVQRSRASAHDALISALGLGDVEAGEAFGGPAGAPLLRGTVCERHPSGLLVRAEQPWPAVFNINTWFHGGVVVSVRAYLYGDGAAAVAAREQPLWEGWLHQVFPSLEKVGGDATA